MQGAVELARGNWYAHTHTPMAHGDLIRGGPGAERFYWGELYPAPEQS
jgi:hypothetical protein